MCKPLKKILKELCIRMRRGDVQRLITIFVLCQKLLYITDFHPALRCKPFSDDADDQHVDGKHTQRSFPRYLQEMCTFQQVLPQRFLFWTSTSLKDFKDLLKMETGNRVSLARVALDKFQSTVNNLSSSSTKVKMVLSAALKRVVRPVTGTGPLYRTNEQTKFISN